MITRIEINDKRLKKRLRTMVNRLEDATPLMCDIAGIMHDAVEENFEQEGRPDKWKPLAAATIKQRTREGNWPGKILQKSQGGLASSLSQHYDARTASVGSNKVYALIQQKGGKAGRGRKVTIPARPFLKLAPEDIAEIKEAIVKFGAGK